MTSESTNSSETIASLGENASLKRTVARLNPGGAQVLVGSGDDAAVIAATDGRFAVTTDTLVEGHDFRTDWSSAYDLGWKAVATNLADVAAMGAVPTALVVALVVPKETQVAWLEGFADGLREACLTLAPGCAVVGGDLASGSQIVVAVTAHGDLQGRAPVLRSGAKAGDIVAVAGTLGQAAAGLTLLQGGQPWAISAYEDWVAVQRRPTPPIPAGPAAAVAGATAMLDISDGLAKDASRIARDSGVTIQLHKLQLQGFEAVLEGAGQAIEVDPFGWVIAGGEDHSLLATFGPKVVIPREFKPIGRVLPASEHGVLLDDAPVPELGWDSVTG
ncbi:MAG: thiamine-phosphate kinase [Micrococcales bacterium]